MAAKKLGIGAAVALAAVLAFGSATPVVGQSVTTTEPAGYVVFPRIVSDPNDYFGTGTSADTTLQLTNTSGSDVTVHCVYINATSMCNTSDTFCRTVEDCDGPAAQCIPQWTAADFTITLTPQQPVGWVAGSGFNPGVENPLDGIIPAVNTDYFVGELKCIHVNNSVDATPVNENVLIGAATIQSRGTAVSDVRSYNALGFQTVSTDGSTQNDKTMCLGGAPGHATCADPEYASCPAKLVLGHFFENANLGANGLASTDLTLVPCSQDIVTLEPTSLVAQFLVFNEFEQRTSASTNVRCTETSSLSDLSFIFDVSVQGTLSGQTHIRPVSSNGPMGLIGLAEEVAGGSAAYHLNAVGDGSIDVVKYVFPTE